MAVHTSRSHTPSVLDVGLQPVAYGHAQREETNMGYAKYIGRVGGLAVALGVGMAVATTPGIAWADDTASASSADAAGTAGATNTSATSESETTTGTTGTSTAAGSQTDGASARGSGAVEVPTSGTSASTDASVRQAQRGEVLATRCTQSPNKSSSETPAKGAAAAEPTRADITQPKRDEDSTATEPEAPAATRARAYVTEEVRVVEPASGGYSSGWFIVDAQGNTWLVTDTYSAVSVINTDPASGTYNTTIATITLPDGAQDVAVSADGSRAYVTHSDGKTITVIDTATNQVIGTFITDQNSTAGWQYITVGPDGRLYITDQADGTTYAVTIGDATAL